MDWQTSEDTVPSSFITDAQARSLLGKPRSSGAWRDGDPVGDRQFVRIGPVPFESGWRCAWKLPFAADSWAKTRSTGRPKTESYPPAPRRSS